MSDKYRSNFPEEKKAGANVERKLKCVSCLGINGKINFHNWVSVMKNTLSGAQGWRPAPTVK